MTKMKIGTGDWIVVCDGRKALILENLGDRMFPNLHTREVREQSGSADACSGQRGSRPRVPVDRRGAKLDRADGLARESERSFLKALAERLDRPSQPAKPRL